MPVQNRGASSSYGRPSSSPLLAIIRGLFFLVCALTLFFALGFFVIARLIPSPATTGGAASGDSGSQPQHNNLTQTSKPAAQSDPQQGLHSAPPPVAGNDGPSLLPENSVQKPDRIDETPKKGNNSDGTTAENGETATPGNGETTDEPGAARSRRDRNTDGVQQPTTPDAQSTERQTSADPSHIKAGVYRVQIGVFSTRDKAEEIAASASDKGFAAAIKVVTRDGRTLYRVQHSTHKDRAKAEAERDKLTEAGFDATIINPN